KMRATLKQSDIHAVEFQHGNQIQHAVVRQQRKREVGAGKFKLLLHTHSKRSAELRFGALETTDWFAPKWNSALRNSRH
ncbi:MAG: hypothetical protein C5B50_09170, partial [Verrucomicrobia bacterium]